MSVETSEIEQIEQPEIVYLSKDLSLPNHSNEICKAEEAVEKLKRAVKELHESNQINDKSHTAMYEEIVRVLDYLGKLSMSAFNVIDVLENLYLIKYKHAPALAKQLWLEDYDRIHHPYSILKNRCFRLLEDLDELYIEKFKKFPPNWNI